MNKHDQGEPPAGRLFELVPDEIDRQISSYSDAELDLQLLQGKHRDLTESLLDAQRALLKSRVLLSLEGKDVKKDTHDLEETIKKLRHELEAVNKDMQRATEQLISSASLLELHSEENRSEHGYRGLVKHRHPNRDFFLADVFDYALKDDGASMEAPIFTLSTNPDLSVWEWRSKDGSKYVKVTPSVLGRATQHDKDVLIYVISQLVEGLNRGREDAKHRTVRFTVYDFLVTTNRDTSGKGYQRLHETFERLRGTTITTDIRTGGERVRQGFGVIDEWRIIEKSPTDERMIAIEVTLSRWLFNAVQAFEVLTIHPDYFRLRKPLARRLYEIARKHCGHQTQWKIGLALLKDKAGSKSSIREFRRALRAIRDDDSLPDYRFILRQDDTVMFYPKDLKRLSQGLARQAAKEG